MKLKKKELIFLGVLLLGLCLWAFWPKPEGAAVTVTVDGTQIGRYSLLKETRLPVDGYGEFSLTLVVEQGQARVEDSTCPDLICQEHTPISRTGKQIVSLPDRVFITLPGVEQRHDAFAA